MIYRPAPEPLTEDHPLVPPSPYGLSKLAQELLGAACIRRLRRRDDRAPVQPHRSAPGSDLCRVRVRQTDRRDRSRAARPRGCRRQPRRTSRYARRARHRAGVSNDPRSRPARAGRTTSAPERPSPSATCWTCSSPARGCRFGYASIPIASSRTTCRCCSAIPAVSATSWDGNPMIPLAPDTRRPVGVLENGASRKIAVSFDGRGRRAIYKMSIRRLAKRRRMRYCVRRQWRMLDDG